MNKQKGKEKVTMQYLRDVILALKKFVILLWEFSVLGFVVVLLSPLWLSIKLYLLLSSSIAQYYSVSSFVSRALAICAIVVVVASGVLTYKFHMLATAFHTFMIAWLAVSTSLIWAGHLFLTNNYKAATVFLIFGVLAIFKLPPTIIVFFYFVVRFYYTTVLAAKFSVSPNKKKGLDESDDSSRIK